MKTIHKIILIPFLAIALTACSTLAPTPTTTPIPTATDLPTTTSTPAPTITPTLTATAISPTETPTEPALTMPTGKPATSWEGFPIMPKAIAGDGDSKGYTFTIQATSDEIQDFYAKAMAKLGWTMFATGKGTTETILLIFMKDTATASVSIIPQADGTMYVLIVK